MPKTKNEPTPTKVASSAKFELVIPKNEVQESYQSTLRRIQAQSEIKGFRKGKAPLEVVEKNSDPTKIYELVFESLVPEKYRDYVVSKGLKPIAAPRVSVKEAKADTDWVFDVEIALKPVIELGNYKDAITSAFAKEAIWTPGKDKEEKKEKPTREQTLSKIFDVLLKTVKVDISPLLVDDEANRTLSQLVDQVNKLGLTVDQYVASLKKSVEDLKKEHQIQAEASVKLEHILMFIADQEKLTATDKEYDEFLATIESQDTLAQIKNNQDTQLAIRYTITKRKVLDFLLKLAGK